MRLFLIGPAGAGKSTTGTILAARLGYFFVDLDREFSNQNTAVSEFIEKNGYAKYCLDNSRFFEKLLKEHTHETIFALSSGFLVHEGLCDLTEKHARLIKDNGISILLLPSRSQAEAENIIVERQLKRNLGFNKNGEYEKIRKNFTVYLPHGDIKIFSAERPSKIAKKIEKEVLKYALERDMKL